MENCPACRRKLISHISPRCNWCGHEIQDASYQAEAEIRREAHAIEEAQHTAQSGQWFRSTVDAYSPYGFGGFVPLGPSRRPQISMPQEVRQRMEAEAAIIAEAARARHAQEAMAAEREAERQERLQEETLAEKRKHEDRFNHLEL